MQQFPVDSISPVQRCFVPLLLPRSLTLGAHIMLSMADASMHEDDLIFDVISGFDVEYLPMIAILQQQSDLNWEEFQAFMLSFESVLTQL
ncbi:hypothetical protein Sjap_005590 [Stephania japonica]|uniref:Uncharacterized protein n=1 Tax=Stephania japonica TaxID=461633 RepID=A0AAP0PIX9_9MAGN